MRRLLKGLPLVLALAAGLAFARRDPEGPPPRLVLLAAGETLGHLEPCECVSGMSGGFPRRLATVARERKDEAPVLHVDTGNLTAPNVLHPRLLTLKTQAALELLARAETAGVVVGEQDLRLGASALARLAQDAGVPLLLANAEGAPFEGARLTEVGGVSVWLAGVIDPELDDPTGQLSFTDPAPALRALLTEAPAAALKVVLYRGTRAHAEAQLPEDLGVDAIVCGDGQQEPGPLARHGGAWLVETVRDARSLARLAFPPEGEPTLTRLELGAQVPDDPWARERVDRYYDAVRALPEEPRKPVKAGGSFMSARSCQGCHQAQYEVFKGTKHHGAQARVIAARPEVSDLGECIRCHVTGYGYESGFESMKLTPHLAEVGCESCHGVGELHVSAGPRDKRGYGVRAGFPESWRERCVSCHDPSNSPDFDFEQALQKIKHWKDR
ncbi:MAG: multiheme c-type cytochrome [Planctomycetota bacterium]